MKSSAVIAVCCAVAAAGLAGCKDGDDRDPLAAGNGKGDVEAFTGTKKIGIGGKAVNVSCSGTAAKRSPVVVLLHGGGDGLDKMAALQKSLSKQHRVCSYDRLGAGGSAQPDGPQDFAATGKVLTGVLARLAGNAPVVLAGHSLGGLIAARYAPEHRDKVKGLVLMDATPATMIADISRVIPASATGPAAQVRAQNLAIFQGQNPEKLVIVDGKVGSAGDIPVEVLKHGKQYLGAIPTYGPRLEQAWSAGQRRWLGLSGRSRLTTAAGSGHYIYLERPDLVVSAVQEVTAQAAR
ncbi:alpha/beta fold hydrolase [Actinomadura rupiterrae]|uniref:alpha/beta fold hydrolase n=1 Tax=Actinomadura rupiterrae TaxID=559627 RepID=UPI0020A3925A|nr:alpha/beta fold hydrolase [Actinomadura rupiterrae]MCP2339318.1 pimeloyl-ACP methyl ester carboxylesterase [Actinomadura rupiterrae]